MGIDYYATDTERKQLLRRWHTVATMMHDCKRSRSWAYQMIASYPHQKRTLCDIRTGKKELAIPKIYVIRYMERVRRGNPNWRA